MSWDKDIPAINQGEGPVSCHGIAGTTSSRWWGESYAECSARQERLTGSTETVFGPLCVVCRQLPGQRFCVSAPPLPGCYL